MPSSDIQIISVIFREKLITAGNGKLHYIQWRPGLLPKREDGIYMWPRIFPSSTISASSGCYLNDPGKTYF